MNKIIVLFSLVLLSTMSITPAFAWFGQMAMDSDNRNVEYGEIINYKGYLYGDPLIEKEMVSVIVSAQDTQDIIWTSTISPSLTTVDYFENTAWTFDFQIDTSVSGFTSDMTYVVSAMYDDQSTKLDFFIKPDNLGEKAADAGEAIVQAGEMTGDVIIEGGTKVGETIAEKGTEISEKAAITNEVVVEKSSEGIQEINEKGGGCLIATATYGSELAPQVQQLREIRDNKLLQTQSGTSFMNGFNSFYYSFSPIIADYERENPVFKEMINIAITPMISSLYILNYVDMDSESKVLGYGIFLILLNLGMYVGIPASVIFGIKRKLD